MKEKVLLFLLLVLCCCNIDCDDSCEQDTGEALFRSEAVLLVRIKKITKLRDVIKYRISVSKVYKELIIVEFCLSRK